MIRQLIFTLLLTLSYGLMIAQPTLNKLWQTDSLSVPESVLLHKENNTLYVSLIGAGDAGAKDGNGTIAKLDLKGNVIQKDWAIGLNSPKGLGKYKNQLYVADLDELVIIAVNSGKVINRIPFPGAGMLNDVTVDSRGNVFVSDSKGGRIYKVSNNKASVYLDKLSNPNGVLAEGSDLYFLDSGVLYKTNGGKQVVKLAEGMEKSTDGLQKYGNNFLVSCWAGMIYFVEKNGEVATLLDTRAEKINTADFAFDDQSHTMYLPTFFKNYVAAYKVE